MNKEEFKAWIMENYNVPNDNTTLAPSMLDGILNYVELLPDENEIQCFLRTVFPDFPDMIIRRVFY